MSPSQLEFFSEWRFCDACGLPPPTSTTRIVENDKGPDVETGTTITTTTTTTTTSSLYYCVKKLSVCRTCQSAAYHNVDCQRYHWTQGGHRSDCQKLSLALQPLRQLTSYQSDSYPKIRRRWWWTINHEDRLEYDRIWQSSVHRWRREEYLEAMEGFQASLRPFWKMWHQQNPDKDDDDGDGDDDIYSYGMVVARRLLFCAYCEADGGQLEFCRTRLVQCISILLPLHNSSDNLHNVSDSDTLNDAWMELMLSYEEIPQHRRLARHVANLAITSGKSSCGWNNPLQRPGYMAHLATEHCPSFVPPKHHPEWCHILEANWETIGKELYALETTRSQSWGAVGSGERGSGSDDHRVVSSGGNWNEYILFGTGAMPKDDDTPVTKRLLREHVPTAVSLAEAGGGEVIFSRLAPHTHIESHCGPTNLRWTAHLGLVVPPTTSSGKCQIRVESTWYQWQVGRILLFDDSFEHEIRNDSDEVRTVLLLRFWHPALNEKQRMVALNEAKRQKELAVEKRYQPPS
jgi:aspartyl/asparaginyl beta-hydroxylase (cupin superfamily)